MSLWFEQRVRSQILLYISGVIDVDSCRSNSSHLTDFVTKEVVFQPLEISQDALWS
jgi:hypothetical protein